MEEKQELDEQSKPVPCKDGMHTFPDPNFAVGPRVCEVCGAAEY